MRRAQLVPGYRRREQEICLDAVKEEAKKTTIMRQLFRQNLLKGNCLPLGFVAQLHVRYSEPTNDILTKYNITPFVLVRNIFDIVSFNTSCSK